MKSDPLSRRKFLHLSAFTVGALGSRFAGADTSPRRPICLVRNPADPIAGAQPANWALQELGAALSQSGEKIHQFDSLAEAPPSELCVVAAAIHSSIAAAVLKSGGLRVSAAEESFALVPARYQDRNILLACANDARGLMYALLELADRVEHTTDPVSACRLQKPVVEEAFNQLRSIGRLFVSDVEDKPWFYDREMWPAYFSMLATQRFNRFSLNFGIGYDSLQNVTESYFVFPYPFLLAVPGYNVRAMNLPDEERDRNLETLQLIAKQAVAHGIDFHLGIWTHGYEWIDTPQSNYRIEGVTAANHAAYSRDALTTLLKACPEISGVTLRIHGESGVHEGSYDFWRTVFTGVSQAGRKVQIDLHTKGLDQKMIDAALATGMPIQLSPKYWAEHMGLPYQQASIRELEMPREKNASDFYALSTGSRSFTRYGYADFLREDRPYRVMYRIWPGTHKFLLWADPASAAAHAQASRFCDSNGVELYEPLSFKGRRGSGTRTGRCAYADSSLNPRYDWQKYLYTYRAWGRLLYNPQSEADIWRRQLRKDLSAGATAAETALIATTRMLSLVTTAHMPSAANDNYGPELYANQRITSGGKSPYDDTPAPKTFGNVSPLDPQLFSSINDFADELLSGERSAKYSPIEVAQWLEDLADTATSALRDAEQRTDNRTPQFRRMSEDVKIQIGIGRFFAAKLRSATLYRIHEKSSDRMSLEEALKAYRRAREMWAEFARNAGRVYVPDITFSPRSNLRGHWLDRLPAMDEDIAEMAKQLDALQNVQQSSDSMPIVVKEVLSRPQRPHISCHHAPPPGFTPNKELEVSLSFDGGLTGTSVRLHYRHVNQAEHYQTLELQLHDQDYKGAIPADYTASPYPLQYYFEVRQSPEKAWLFPGFNPDLTSQPYFVLRSADARSIA
jgi:hypothetical protein